MCISVSKKNASWDDLKNHSLWYFFAAIGFYKKTKIDRETLTFPDGPDELDSLDRVSLTDDVVYIKIIPRGRMTVRLYPEQPDEPYYEISE